MNGVIVDTDIVSYLFKKDTRTYGYRKHLLGKDGVPLVTNNRADHAGVDGVTILSEFS